MSAGPVEIAELTEAGLEDVVDLALATHRRRERWAEPDAQHVTETDLRTAFSAAVRTYLEEVDRRCLVAAGPQGPIAALGVQQVRLGPGDEAFTYQPPRHLSVPFTAVMARDSRTAAQALPSLVRAQGEFGAEQDRDVLLLPSLDADWEIASVLRTAGLAPNTVFAFRVAAVPAGQSDIPVRAATEHDRDAIVELFAQEQSFHIAHTDSGMSPDQDRRTLERMVAGWFDHGAPETTERAFVVDVDGAVRAVSTVHVVHTPPQTPAASLFPARYTYVGMTCVHEDSRGQGLGAALSSHAVRWTAALPDPPRVIGLHYVADNPLSGPFWSRAGYAPFLTTMAAPLRR